MKGPCKKAVQQAILDLMRTNVTKIQCMYRTKVARATYQRRLGARIVIRRAVLKYMKQRKWEKDLESYASDFLDIVIRI